MNVARQKVSRLFPGILIPTFILLLIGIRVADAATYTPPVGIPMPPFGILESNMDYTVGGDYKDAGNGPYTVLVDNRAANCSDSGPGTREQPRCSIPFGTAAAGEVVEVHGGPYNFANAIKTINSSGTASKPVIYRGVDDGSGFPVMYQMSRIELAGSYLIVENFIFDESFVIVTGGDHISIRNNELKDHPDKNGSTLTGQYLVFYKNHVHHYQGPDRHGTTVSAGSKYIWILDNYYHHNGGQGIQFCHGCSTNPPEYLFIGRNESHSNRENGFATKYGNYVVFSQNLIHDHIPSEKNVAFYYDDGTGPTTATSGSDGTCLTLGADGYGHDIWVIFNEVYNCSKGIRFEESLTGFAVGNLVYDSGIGLAYDKAGEGPHKIAFNTIYNANTGLMGTYQGGGLELDIQDNIFAKISGTSIDMDMDDSAAMSLLSNNLFDASSGSISIVWKTPSTFTSGSGIDSFVKGTGNIIGDPVFVSPATKNFRVVSGVSDAQAKADNVLETLDAKYKATFGSNLSIMVDLDGNPRFMGSLTNTLGSYEATEGKAPPSAPMLIQ